jgi:hypothetical protein
MMHKEQMPVLSPAPHTHTHTHTLPYLCCWLQVYISGHGGNEFMKFQDTEELMAQVGLWHNAIVQF